MTCTEENLLDSARAFAIAAHSAIGQVRKYTGEPYWHHPMEVAALVRDNAPDAPPSVLAGAMLHDVIDDTHVTLALIVELFGNDVGEIVSDLSDIDNMGSNRRERKAFERQKIAKASPWSKTVRLADMYSNLRSVADHDPTFARTYFAEKRLLLPCLSGGHRTLFARVQRLIDDYYARLERT